MSARKAEFWWASIHGADPEPVEKAEHDGRPCVYTLGCADPFYLDETPCAVLLIPSYPHKRMDRPKHPDIQAAEEAEQIASIRARGHAWRGPR